MRVVCILLKGKKFIEKIAESALNFSPQVAISHEAVFMEISKCAKLYSEEQLLQSLSELLQCFEAKASVCIDDDIPSALSRARYRCSKDKLPIEAIQDYYGPFLEENFTKDISDKFHKLGVHTIGQLLKLETRQWTLPFGKIGSVLAQRLVGASHVVWPYFEIAESIHESIELSDTQSVESLDAVFFLIKRVMDRALARLIGRGEKLSSLRIELEEEKYSTIEDPLRSWDIEFPLPQRYASSILPIVRDRIESAFREHPLRAPVVGLTLEVTQSCPGAALQLNFFSREIEEQEAWASLLARLTEKLGEDNCYFASPVERLLPERSWEKTINEPTQMKLPYPKRPLKLLHVPRRLQQIDDFLFYKGKRWRVTEKEGPEHIKGEWWFQDFDRNYYRIGTQSGERLWAYEIPGDEQNNLYLHGYFD